LSNRTKREKKYGGVPGLIKRQAIKNTVEIGIIDAGNHSDSALTVAEIGFLHEFGSKTIPERSFLRSTIFDKKQDIVELQVQLIKKINMNQMTMKQALGNLGEVMKGEVQQKIVDIDTPPNSPFTIEKKGSSNPLIDNEQMKNSITYKVNV